ncbi:MAG: hypothetical protein AAF441_28580, partial [Pseudomonadota bacterium]
MKFKLFENTVSSIRFFVVNFLIILSLVALIPLILGEITSKSVIIEKIAAPKALTEVGMTGEALAHRLSDSIDLILAGAKIGDIRESAGFTPKSRKLNISIPETGISLESISQIIRRFFGSYETRISGEIQCAKANCEDGSAFLRVRIHQKETSTFDSSLDLTKMYNGEDFLTNVAQDILREIDPFALGLFFLFENKIGDAEEAAQILR